MLLEDNGNYHILIDKSKLGSVLPTDLLRIDSTGSLTGKIFHLGTAAQLKKTISEKGRLQGDDIYLKCSCGEFYAGTITEF